ncbi:hypothetical protein ABK040_008728 [Willaertia magna]
MPKIHTLIEEFLVALKHNAKMEPSFKGDANIIQIMLREPKYYNQLIKMNQIDKYCVFCNQTTINEGLVDESQHFRCLYNIRPVFPGHTLIIPKTHYSRFSLMPSEHATDFVNFTQLVTKALRSIYSTDSIEYLIQEGEHSGQSISHLHLHLMPRQLNDLPSDIDWMDYFANMEHKAKLLTVEERQQCAKKIKQEMIRIRSDNRKP